MPDLQSSIHPLPESLSQHPLAQHDLPGTHASESEPLRSCPVSLRAIQTVFNSNVVDIRRTVQTRSIQANHNIKTLSHSLTHRSSVRVGVWESGIKVPNLT